MLKQSLKLKLSQKLSPQQIQLMKLIQLPVLDFEQKLKQEIEENPALEITELTNNDEFNDDENIDVEDYINDDEIPRIVFFNFFRNNCLLIIIVFLETFVLTSCKGNIVKFKGATRRLC